MKSKITFLVILLSTFGLTAQRSSNQLKFKGTINQSERGEYQLQNLERGIQNNALNSNYYSVNDHEIILECDAIMNVKADSYLLIFNITQVAQTAKEADELINKRINAFVESLAVLAIRPTDVHQDMIYLIPVFEFEVEKKLFSKTYNEVPKGFEMQKNVHVKFKKSDIVDDIVTLAATNEIYDLVTIEYFVKNQQLVFDSLRSASINYIDKNARKLEKLGIDLEEPHTTLVEQSNIIFPEDRYSDYESFVSQSIEAAKDKAVTTVRKPKTVAYNKLPYNQFDIVINPEFLEPVVQFTYKLKVKYSLEKDKPKPVNHYFILDNNGNLKEVILKP